MEKYSIYLKNYKNTFKKEYGNIFFVPEKSMKKKRQHPFTESPISKFLQQKNLEIIIWHFEGNALYPRAI